MSYLYTEIFIAIIPDVLILLTAFTVLGVDYGVMQKKDRRVRSALVSRISVSGLLFAVAVLITQFAYCEGIDIELSGGQIVLNPLSFFFKIVIYLLAIPVVIFMKDNIVCEHVSEHYAMILLSVIGAGILAMTQHLLIIFIAIELVSLCLYTLTAFRKESVEATEAAFKYFAIGGLASAFLLFGFSYLYGVTNTLNLSEIPMILDSVSSQKELIFVSILFIIVGFGFKIAVVPFHLWAPDTYEWSSTPVTAWIAAGSKVGAVFVLTQILQPFLFHPDYLGMVITMLICLCVLSLLVGSFGALKQTNVKRILAYSAIAHGGYLLLGYISGSFDGMISALYYIIGYAIASVGVFGVISIMSDKLGRDATLADFKGCWKFSPLLGFLFLVFILSLAGIPPFAGFTSKMYLFYSVIKAGDGMHVGHLLVAFALCMSAVSLYYYIKILKAFLVTNADEAVVQIKGNFSENTVLVLLALALLMLGIWPEPILGFLGTFL